MILCGHGSSTTCLDVYNIGGKLVHNYKGKIALRQLRGQQVVRGLTAAEAPVKSAEFLTHILVQDAPLIQSHIL